MSFKIESLRKLNCNPRPTETTRKSLIRQLADLKDDRQKMVPVGVRKKIVAWARSFATKNSEPEYQFALASFYDRGTLGQPNLPLAFKWYLRAAQNGHPIAQYNVGLCYEKGVGVRRNPTLAFVWYQKSARSGDAQAQINLGWCYSVGFGVKKTPKKAVSWFRRAMNLGHPSGAFNLGLCYLDGEGLRASVQRAIKHFKVGASLGHVNSLLMLGEIFLGLVTNEVFEPSRAIKYLLKAAELGSLEAQSLLLLPVDLPNY